MRQTRTCLFVLACCLSAVLAFGQGPPPTTLRLAGEIRFTKNAPLYLVLLSQDAAGQETAVRRQVLSLTPDDAKRGSIHYELPDLPAGRYALRCFQDTSGNAKLDIGMFGPKEPWGNYRRVRPRTRAPRFDEMAFDLRQDLLTADLRLE